MYKRVEPKKLTGKETFKNANKEFSVLQFWQFAFSNLNSNVLRGDLAEFFIENALRDVEHITIKNPWGDFDVVTNEGTKIETKCSAFLQDWDQKELSKPLFSGLRAKDLYWNSAVSDFKADSGKDYKSDIYVFVLQNHKNPETLNLLDMNQWEFFVLSRDELKEISKNASSVSLVKLQKENVEPIHFNGLRQAILSKENF
ncbi:hypothetical protein JXA34_02025 [Patescibacteria group bacterium]|nr:hypothetical protein [Patescibacteria group bacterium]